MEDGLVLIAGGINSYCLFVLILIVVEDGLVLAQNTFFSAKLSDVLILIVVEDGLVLMETTIISASIRVS